MTGVGLGDSRQKLFFLPRRTPTSSPPSSARSSASSGVARSSWPTPPGLARRAHRLSRRDDHGTYLAFGMTMLLALQALINLGVAMGQLPTKGLTLPFISYGGSSLIVDLAAIGVLLSVSRTAKGKPAPRGRPFAHDRGGGTGGHVFPGIAVADALAAACATSTCAGWAPRAASRRGCCPTTPWRFEAMELTGLNGVRGRALSPPSASSPGRARVAYNLLRSNRPHAVLGVGGYAGGPSRPWPRRWHPAAVLEPNAIPGLTNRLLARFVRRAFVTHEETLGAFPRGVAEVTGSPVRRGFLKRMGSDVPTDAPLHVLVVGGSQGARAINAVVPDGRGRARVAGTARHGDAPDRRGEPRRGGRALRGAGGRGRGAGPSSTTSPRRWSARRCWCAARAR
jgi:hypothetical protein